MEEDWEQLKMGQKKLKGEIKKHIVGQKPEHLI